MATKPGAGRPKRDKAEKKAARQAAKAARSERMSQMWQAFQMQRREDKALLPIMIGTVVGVTALLLVVGFLLGQPVLLGVLGLVMGVLVAVIVFGRRMQRNVYAKANGQPGAAGWALDNMRGRWRVTQAVAGTTQLDAVHRVIGRPGVILVGEGAPHRVKGLLGQEKKRIARLVGQTPIYETMVGEGEEQVELSKLQRHLSRLPRNITTKQMDEVEKRLAALASRSGPAMPKGPMPKGAQMKGMQRTVRRR